MATCNDVIRRALQKARVLAEGEDPTAEQAADGLTALQSLLDGWVTGGMFGALTDVYKSAAYTAKEFERVRKDAAVTITIPDTIEDPQTGETRTPRDRACIQVVYPSAGTKQSYLYDAQVGDWVQIQSLALTDDTPLQGLGVDGLASVLALDVADEYGVDVTPSTAAKAARFVANLSGQFNSDRYRAVGSYF